MVMVLQIRTYLQTHQVVCIAYTYAQLFVCQSYTIKWFKKKRRERERSLLLPVCASRKEHVRTSTSQKESPQQNVTILAP